MTLFLLVLAFTAIIWTSRWHDNYEEFRIIADAHRAYIVAYLQRQGTPRAVNQLDRSAPDKIVQAVRKYGNSKN